MLQIVVHSAAEAEIKAASTYYESLQAGLGDSFLREVAQGFNQIQNLPLGWAILFDDIRRYLLHRFPYGIVYRVEADRIFVLAVMHLRRKPNYWRVRDKS